MGRNYGINPEKFYSEQDFKDGCWLNLVMGAAAGVVFTVVFEFFFMWVKGWI